MSVLDRTMSAKTDLIALVRSHADPDELQGVMGILDEAIDGIVTTPDTEIAVNMMLRWLCPPPCEQIGDNFWATPAGQYLAQARYAVYADQLITKADAARILYGGSEARHLMAVEHRIKTGELRTVRKPNKAFTNRRPSSRRVGGKLGEPKGAWLVFAEDVQKLKEKLG